MGRGANKFITDQATTASPSHAGLPPPGPPPPPPQPADYHFPFGNPALLISTLPSRKHLPLHLLYRPPPPPEPQHSKPPEPTVVELDEEPESLEVNEALREPEMKEGVFKTQAEVQAEGALSLEDQIRNANPTLTPREEPQHLKWERLRRIREADEPLRAEPQFPGVEKLREAREAEHQPRLSWKDRRKAAVQQPMLEVDIPIEDGIQDRLRPDLAVGPETYAQVATAVAQDQAPLSDQIHILGSDIRAKFLAYSLAGLPKAPPVQLLLNQKYDFDVWKDEGQAINLFRGDKGSQRDRIEAEWIFDRNHRRVQGGRIDQLIVTLPCAYTVRAISQIRDRIDHNTTICLVQEGLGVVEALNATVFRESWARPHYVLGHMTHILGHSRMGYTLSEMIPGQLALTAFDGRTSLEHISFYPPIERRVREAYFLQLLTLDPELRAGGFRYSKFLQRKFPDMIFRSAIDPVVAVLGITYAQVLNSPYARSLVDQLISEISAVIVALPEAREVPALAEYVTSGQMYRHCKARLFKRSTQSSLMADQVAKGLETEIDFLNGYFMRRGAALGIGCPSNDMVIGMLKAKQTLVREDIEKRMPYVGYGPPGGYQIGNRGVKKFATQKSWVTPPK